MQLEVPNLMENELAKQMEDDLRRLLAGTDIRADGTAITADSLDANIKNLFGSSFYETPKSNGAFEPTVSGANSPLPEVMATVEPLPLVRTILILICLLACKS